ncbi:SMC-Scp complex subunit ScpB [Arenibaculum pallidiluteum]|uniref:SMC-Scp complex subunit ScpB n=1 Tax=Arenibaculum pallidiluteum TaxID=2812559 RepID=UPI001A95BFF0|nr:SMC-Scp complex subunit ScpB [Arenibaculum pallidiluteum]
MTGLSPDLDPRNQKLRLLEALLFAAVEPLDQRTLAARMGDEADLGALLDELREIYRFRGVNLVCTGGRWWFRTAPDLADKLRVDTEVTRRLSRAAVETLSIIAYQHAKGDPVTRAEIESIRGVATSKGTLDLLMEAGWVRPGKRKETPGRPLTWLTTDGFLDHFGLESLRDLPGVDELKAAGLLDSRPVLASVPGGGDALPESASADEDADGPEE